MGNQDGFKIYIDRLRKGNTEIIEETFDAGFLNEEPFKFDEPVTVNGTVYLVDDHLILNLNIATKVRTPCSVCSEDAILDLHIERWDHQEPISSCKHGIYNFQEQLRAAILLEIPNYPKCGVDSCINRHHIEKYLRKEIVEEDVYSPFKDL